MKKKYFENGDNFSGFGLKKPKAPLKVPHIDTSRPSGAGSVGAFFMSANSYFSIPTAPEKYRPSFLSSHFVNFQRHPAL